MSYRWHGELEGQASWRLVELNLVILGVVLPLEHRLGVLCNEGIHLECVWGIRRIKSDMVEMDLGR